MKNKIIVPVDFSMNSLNAYIYARELAVLFDARIEVVHVYQGSFDNREPMALRAGMGRKEMLQERLDDFVKLYPKEEGEGVVATQLSVQTRLIHGFPVKSVINISKEEKVLMTVMGATGEHDAVDKFIGSVSSEVVQKAYCPVLLIPKGMKYRPFQNILYSSNYESVDQEMLERIMRFNKHFGAALHFVHVQKKKDETYDHLENKIFEKLFESGDPDFSFNLATIQAPSVLKGLLQYSSENNIDLIVTVNRERGFFESLFGASLTKQIALRSTVPILAYHA